ncbi:MAG: uroporphyrinogen decarboxylase family protein, partial [Clostridiales bacterium]|nr:uroporphyrinogen decarboxylase family protein [Clostridiales bacterium]
WNEIKKRVLKTDKPLTILDPMSGTFGFYSMLRNWIGTEGLSYMLYDDPDLVRECLEVLTEFVIDLFSEPLKEINFDLYYIHEDMCYKNGPLMSPEHFKEFLLPCYKRFTDLLRSNGVKVILVDTDGNFEKLIPLFLESGIDGFGPIEVAAGMDPLDLRKRYGKSFCMVGGIDKREIAKGKREIENQVYNVIAPLLESGGFIPTIDHAIPPDVSLENYLYYNELRKKVILGK